MCRRVECCVVSDEIERHIDAGLPRRLIWKCDHILLACAAEIKGKKILKRKGILASSGNE